MIFVLVWQELSPPEDKEAVLGCSEQVSSQALGSLRQSPRENLLSSGSRRLGTDFVDVTAQQGPYCVGQHNNFALMYTLSLLLGVCLTLSPVRKPAFVVTRKLPTHNCLDLASFSVRIRSTYCLLSIILVAKINKTSGACKLSGN